MSADTTAIFNARQTAGLLEFPKLVQAVRTAAADYARGAIDAPARQAVPFPQGAVMLSMPATARDIGIHKLVNVAPANRRLALPTIHGLVSAYDGQSGEVLFVLDGPTVTARRTAAVSMLALGTLLGQAPKHVAVLGTGRQAAGHLEALAALFPGTAVFVAGRSAEGADAFVQAHGHLDLRLESGTAAAIPPDSDAIITATSSKVPVYREPARPGRLLIAVGAFEADAAEIAAPTVLSSRVYVDDPAGARHEAGDIIQAGADWMGVRSLADALDGAVDFGEALLFKSVGCAAWDLAAARCARTALQQSQ